MALFGNTATAATSKNLVEFRAGKMNLRGTTVTADKRKGRVYIYQSDDSLMHFCWQDRTSGTLEDDLIIFPDDIEFKKLPQCTTGRAFILKFKSSSRKFFFWMQEPKEDKDEENCKKVNELLNNPPAPGSSNAAGSGGGRGAGLAGLQPALASLGDQLGDSSLQSLLNNMDQNQLMQLLGMSGLGGAGGLTGDDDSSSRASSRNATASSARQSTTPAAATSAPVSSNTSSTTPQPASNKKATTESSAKPPASTGGGAVQLSDLQNILSTMQTPTPNESVDLSASFSTEALLPLLKDKDIQARLKPFLPAVENLPATEDGIKDTLQSPQFKQALSTFSAALSSGQLAPLMQQFKLPQSAIDAAAKGDIIGFTKALQAAESSKKEEEEEDMALD